MLLSLPASLFHGAQVISSCVGEAKPQSRSSGRTRAVRSAPRCEAQSGLAAITAPAPSRVGPSRRGLGGSRTLPHTCGSPGLQPALPFSGERQVVGGGSPSGKQPPPSSAEWQMRSSCRGDSSRRPGAPVPAARSPVPAGALTETLCGPLSPLVHLATAPGQLQPLAHAFEGCGQSPTHVASGPFRHGGRGGRETRLCPAVTSAPGASPLRRYELQPPTGASRCRRCGFAEGGRGRWGGAGPQKPIQSTREAAVSGPAIKAGSPRPTPGSVSVRRHQQSPFRKSQNRAESLAAA